jgi:hypothetical protein
LNKADRRAALLRVALGRGGPVIPESVFWEHWLKEASAERGTPLLFQIVAHVPTDLRDEQREQIWWQQRRTLVRSVRLEHHLIGVAERLSELGIAFAVLKGAATAHLDYPDASWREFVDIDVLIDPADRPRATALLGRDGWVQGYALPRGHEEHTHAVTLTFEGVELDLHQRIGHRALGVLVPTRELLDRATPFEIAGVELRSLGEIDRLIHAALHAVSSRGINRRLSSVADVLLLAHRRSHLAAEVLARAEHWKVRSLVERAVVDAYKAAQLDVDALWAAAMSVPVRRRDRLVDRAYLGAGRRPVAEELAHLRVMDGWKTRWRYLRGYLATDPDYARQHGRSGLRAQAGYLARKLRSGS